MGGKSEPADPPVEAGLEGSDRPHRWPEATHAADRYRRAASAWGTIRGIDPPIYGVIRQGVGKTGHFRGKAGISGSCQTIIPNYINHMTAAVWQAFYLALIRHAPTISRRSLDYVR